MASSPADDDDAPFASHEIAVPLPQSPDAHLLQLSITNSPRSLLIYATIAGDAAAADGSGGGARRTAPLGAFAFAMPPAAHERAANAGAPLGGVMLTPDPFVADTASRLARALTHRTMKPVYLGFSVRSDAGGSGGTAAWGQSRDGDAVTTAAEGEKLLVDAVMGVVAEDRAKREAGLSMGESGR